MPRTAEGTPKGTPIGANENHTSDDTVVREGHRFMSVSDVWSSVEWITRLYWVSGAVVAAFTCLALIFGIRQSQLNRRDTEIAEKAAEKSKHDADVKITEANRVAEEARKRATDLEEQQKPRLITPEQRAQFINFLRFAPKGQIGVYITTGVDPETANLADQIRTMLSTAGYDSGRQLGLRMGASVHEGVFVVVVDSKNPLAGPIQQALAIVGIEAKGAVVDKLVAEQVQISVGTKPKPHP